MNNKPSNNNVLIWVVVSITAILVLVLFGWRIGSISIPLGPVGIDMESPAKNDNRQPEIVSPAQVDITEPVQPAQPPNNVDFNPPLSLPFFDDFDQGPDPEWRISGNFLINNGRLVGADTVTLEIGNNALNTYLVEFDVFSPSEFCGWAYNNYLVIGVTPTLQYRAAYTDAYSRGWWYALQNGEWQEIARDEIGVSNGSCTCNVRVFVNGNSYEIYANGSLTTKIVYGNSTGAPFMIGTSQTPHIDNLTIRQP